MVLRRWRILLRLLVVILSAILFQGRILPLAINKETAMIPLEKKACEGIRIVQGGDPDRV